GISRAAVLPTGGQHEAPSSREAPRFRKRAHGFRRLGARRHVLARGLQPGAHALCRRRLTRLPSADNCHLPGRGEQEDRRMKFIQEFGYTVKVGQEEAHQKWAVENDERLRKAAPPGSKYIGTFIAVYSTEKHAGGYRVLLELDSYGALDTGAATTKDPNSEWSKLVVESSKFTDTDWNMP